MTLTQEEGEQIREAKAVVVDNFREMEKAWCEIFDAFGPTLVKYETGLRAVLRCESLSDAKELARRAFEK